MIIIFQTASLKLRKYDFFPISMCFIYNLFAEAFDFPRKYRFSDEKWFDFDVLIHLIESMFRLWRKSYHLFMN